MAEEPEGTTQDDWGTTPVLTRKQREAIPYLVGARSLEQGCKEAKLGKTTLYHWLKDEAFRDALEKAREDVARESIQRLKANVTKAVDGLIELAGDDEKWIRLRACERVLDFFLKFKELEVIEGRLEKIEKVVWERRTYR